MGLAVTLVLLAASALDRSAPTVQACGPITTYPIFTPEDAPDDPRYVSGNLGILQQGYRRPYLIAAWRTLVGQPLSKGERAILAPLLVVPDLQSRLTPPPRRPIEVWQSARQAVNTGPGSRFISQDMWIPPTYTYIRNCGDSAFLKAAETLAARSASLGATSPVFLDWVTAQDQVFSNCGRQPGQAPTIPPSLGPDASASARADRAYQIAAAQLYGGQFAEAEAGFAAIAHDPQSPWRPWAPYLAARAMIRQGTMGGKDAAGDPAALERAAHALEAIVADPSLAEMHEPARKLLPFVRARTEPEAVLTETAKALSSPEVDGKAFQAHLDDFIDLMNHFRDRITPDERADKAFGTVRQSSELIDWVVTFQGRGSNVAEHALERWNRGHSEAWLVAALANLQADDPHQADLVASAADVPVGSPAYPTVTFHRVRLLLLAGRRDEARTVLSQALRTSGLPVSSANLFKSMRMLTAQTLDEFLTDAVRIPVGDTGGWVGYHGEALHLTLGPALDGDAVPVLNERMSVATLRRVAASAALPPATRRDVILALFTRALLLNDVGTARAAIPLLVAAVPTLRAPLARVSAASDEATFLDEGTLLLLASPGLRPFVAIGAYRRPESLGTIDSLRDNWWCSFVSTAGGTPPYETEYWRGVGGPSGIQRSFRLGPDDLGDLGFLTAAERNQAATEWRTLQSIDTAPNELGRRAITWAETHARDPRAPYVLHLVVRAGHYGCTDAATGAISKRAFERLHRQYPESTWAKRTPFWFK